VKFRDLDGKWKMVPSKRPTKAQVELFTRNAESRVSAGQVGAVPLAAQALCGPLITTRLAALRNRNADDDRSRVKRQL
jgi:hypothetical protein